MNRIFAALFSSLLFLERAFAQDEVDLSAQPLEKTYPYYDPFIRNPAFLLLPLSLLLFIALHLIKSNKRKPAPGRAPDVFFYPESEKTHEIQK